MSACLKEVVALRARVAKGIALRPPADARLPPILLLRESDARIVSCFDDRHPARTGRIVHNAVKRHAQTVTAKENKIPQVQRHVLNRIAHALILRHDDALSGLSHKGRWKLYLGIHRPLVRECNHQVLILPAKGGLIGLHVSRVQQIKAHLLLRLSHLEHQPGRGLADKPVHGEGETLLAV